MPEAHDAANAYARAREEIVAAKAKASSDLHINLPGLRELPREIGELSDLRELRIRNTGITDFSPIATLKSLQLLDLSDAKIDDLSFLASLDSLHTLYLPNAQISDLSPLALLPSIETLSLATRHVTDFSPLAKLRSLRHLMLHGAQLSDAEVLTHLTGLEALELPDTKITDAGPLARLTGLKYLDVSGTPIADARPLAALTSLERLVVSGTQISDLRPLVSLQDLRKGYLYIAECAATRLDPYFDQLLRITDLPEQAGQILDYLASLGDDWPPVPKAPVDIQNPRALTFATDTAGRIIFNTANEPAELPPQGRLLHGLLREQATELRHFCTTPNNEHGRLCDKLARYLLALGDGPEAMAPPPIVWVTGNELRNILKADGEKRGEELGEVPPLGPDRRADLTSLVQTHNAFSALHPDLVQLDHDSIDPVDRVFEQEDRAALHRMARLIELQIRMIVDQVREDFASLDAAAHSNTTGAVRALSLESESLHNLVKLVVAETIIRVQAKDGPAIGGEIRSGLIAAGTAMVLNGQALNPAIATNLSELMVLLQPYAATLLSCWQGNTGNLGAAMDWVVFKLRSSV